MHSAYTPLGITATTRKVADFLKTIFLPRPHLCLPCPGPVGHSTAIEAYKKTGGCRYHGACLRPSEAKLFELAERHPAWVTFAASAISGPINCQNRKTKAPFNVKSDKITGTPLMTAKIAADAMNGRVPDAWYDNLIIAPPLIITEAQVDEGIAALDKALEIADAQTESTKCRSATARNSDTAREPAGSSSCTRPV